MRLDAFEITISGKPIKDAISRAKEKLYLTYSGKKHTYFIDDEMKKFAKEFEY